MASLLGFVVQFGKSFGQVAAVPAAYGANLKNNEIYKLSQLLLTII